MGENGEPLSLYKGGRKLCAPTSLVKLAYPPSIRIDGAVGLPIPVLMGIP